MGKPQQTSNTVHPRSLTSWGEACPLCTKSLIRGKTSSILTIISGHLRFSPGGTRVLINAKMGEFGCFMPRSVRLGLTDMPPAPYCSENDKRADVFTKRLIKVMSKDILVISSFSRKRRQPLRCIRIEPDRKVAPKTAFVQDCSTLGRLHVHNLSRTFVPNGFWASRVGLCCRVAGKPPCRRERF